MKGNRENTKASRREFLKVGAGALSAYAATPRWVKSHPASSPAGDLRIDDEIEVLRVVPNAGAVGDMELVVPAGQPQPYP